MIKSTTLDKVAVMLSGVCILHCLLAPIVMTLVPIIFSNTLFSDLVFHQLMLWLVVPSSVIALFIGCRQHRNSVIAITGILGISMLIIVAFVGHEYLGDSMEKVASGIAGLLLAVSHILNYRTCQSIRCSDSDCQSQHHH